VLLAKQLRGLETANRKQEEKQKMKMKHGRHLILFHLIAKMQKAS
jgi:hypothetical protein